MAYQIIDETYCPYAGAKRKEIICDTDADLAKLPPCCVGSTAVSIESGKVMVVNTQGKWVAFGEKGGMDSIVGTWQFNSTLSRACPITAKINFTTNNNLVYYEYDEQTDTSIETETNSFIGIYTPYATALQFIISESSGAFAGGMGSFESGFDGVIHITDGDDIANEELIVWLNENATKVG